MDPCSRCLPFMISMKLTLKYMNQTLQPRWKQRCLSPANELKIEGEKARNPRDMMANATHAAALRWEGECVFDQRNRAVSGERTKKMEGIPKIPCRRKGKGKRPAPAMEMEYERISHAGTVLSFVCWQALRKPKANSTLRMEQDTSPAVKRNWEGVPNVPSSLTIREK